MGFPTKFEFLCKQQIIFFAYVCPKCCRGHTLKIIPCLSEIQIELGVLYFIWHFNLEVEERDKKKKKPTKASIYASQRRVLLNAPGLRSSPQHPFILTVTHTLEGKLPRVESSMVWTKSSEALAPPNVCTCSDSLR